MSIFLARQGIYDRKGNMYAYELLYRSSNFNGFTNDINEEYATIKLMSNITTLGIYEITDGKRAFINCPQIIIANNLVTIFPKERIVVEVLESVKLTENIKNNLRELRKLGYLIALDDIIDESRAEEFLEFIDIIKIDFKLTDKAKRKRILEKVENTKIMLLAEKIETQEEFEEAYENKYDYFQGYYFNKPIMIEEKSMNVNQKIYFMILLELGKEEFNMEYIEHLIKGDSTLSFKLIKFLNCVHFGFSQPIQSIKHAISLLGRKELRKWLILISVSEMSEDSDIANRVIIRARFCELIQELIDNTKSSKAFMVGLFSNLDVSMDRQMEEILNGLYIDNEIKAALLGEKNILNLILELVKCYEAFNLERVIELCEHLGIEKDIIIKKYMESIQWGKELFVETNNK